MSCHDIGRGLNEVTRLVIDMYDKQEIVLSQAKRLIATCGIAVYWCDGHEAEAKDCIIRCRCGNPVPDVHCDLYSAGNIPGPTRTHKAR